jgi:hypothetical protein
MGRPSGTSFGPIIPGEKLPPPPDLTPDAAAEWIKIVDGCPAQFFGPENGFLLAELCSHVAYSKSLRAAIERAKGTDDSKAVARLLRLHGEQSQRIASLSTKLHLAPSSRYRPEKAERAARGEGDTAVRPWDDNGRPMRKPWDM